MPIEVDHTAILTALEADKTAITTTYKEETGYGDEDIAFLWRDLRGFFEGFEQAVRQHREAMTTDARRYDQFRKGTRLTYYPWGNVLVVLPTNALIPLMPMIATSFVQTGNHMTVAVPGKLRKTANLLAGLLGSCLGAQFTALSAGIKDVLYNQINDDLDFLYYIGGSAQKMGIVTACIDSHTDFIFEGEGKSIAIVDGKSDDYIQRAADLILTSKSKCLGRLCTSCNTVLVSREAAPTFTEKLLSLANAWAVSDNKEMSPSFPFQEGQRELYEGTYSNRQVRWATYAIDSVPLNYDMFSQSFFLAVFESDYELQTALRRYNGGIQVALFVEDRADALQEIVCSATGVARLTIDCDPTVQNSLLPWGGYKSGGPSFVATFLEKSMRRVIVEH